MKPVPNAYRHKTRLRFKEHGWGKEWEIVRGRENQMLCCQWCLLITSEVIPINSMNITTKSGSEQRVYEWICQTAQENSMISQLCTMHYRQLCKAEIWEE